MRRSLLQRAATVASIVALALTAGVVLSGPAAVADPAVVLPTIPVNGSLDSNTQGILGPDGNLWVTMGDSGAFTNELVKLSPAGVPTYYDIPTVFSMAGITVGPDGNLWATYVNGVVKIPLAAPLTATVTPIFGFTEARGITNGGDGFLYAGSGSKVYKISPANPAGATSLNIPAAGTLSAMSARGITTGTDGRIWVADASGSVVAVEKSLSSTYFRFDTGGGLQGIGAGPNGQVLYTNPGLSANENVGRISFNGTPALTATPLMDPGPSVVFAPDGAYWFAQFAGFNVARVTTAGALTTVGTFPAPYHPRNIAIGSGGNLWVLAEDPGNTGAIGRISGVVAPPPPAPTDTSATVDVKGKTVTVSRGGKTAGKGSVKLSCPATEASGPCTGTITQGGYSTHVVVVEDFVLKVPESIPYESAAPLLCAGITTYSPLNHWNVGPGSKVAVVGLGGLGHMAVKIAHAMGAEVTVLSQSLKKQEDGLRLGADHYYATEDKQTFRTLRNSFDLIVNSVSAPLDLDAYLGMLRLNGTMVNVGAPPEALPLHVFSLFNQRRSLAGSGIGGIRETQEMLDFCAEHGIAPETELISADQINEAYERVLVSDVRYRFVIDIATLP